MRLGVMADIHGNDLALRAVLDDAATCHVDRWWILGDLVLLGPRPAEVLGLLGPLPGVEMLRGNTDRYVLTGEQPAPHATAADAAGNVGLVERYGLMAAGIGWTRGVLCQAGLLATLAGLPRALRLDLPDGPRVLGVHASPGADDGLGIEPGLPEEQLSRLLAGCGADVVIGGHTHIAADRFVGGIRALNPGSTGMPERPGEASWLLLELKDGLEQPADPADGAVASLNAEHRVASFDVDAVVRDLRARLHPNMEFLAAIHRPAPAGTHGRGLIGDRLLVMLVAGDDLERSSILDVVSYDVALDLTHGPDRFRSRTEVRFRCLKAAASSFVDVHAVRIRHATLNGVSLDAAAAAKHAGRLELPGLAAENSLFVDAEFAYTSAIGGLHYVTDARDGSAFVYGKSSDQGAPRIYCCFDRPGLRAPFTISVTAPAGWSCLANAPVISRPPAGDPGRWRFAPSAPIPPWLTSFCAGPLCAGPLTAGPAPDPKRASSEPPSVTVQAVPSAAALLASVPVTELLRRSLLFYQDSLGVPYPYDQCDLVFAPITPALAYAVTGLILIQDQVLQERQQGTTLYVPAVIAHELAHAWFGGLVTMPRDQMWLDEALATYISRTALTDIFPGSTPWAAATSATLPDDAYAGYAAPIRQLEDLIGQRAIIDGLGILLRRHAHSEATKDDLVESWSQASGQDLSAWAARSLIPATGNGRF